MSILRFTVILTLASAFLLVGCATSGDYEEEVRTQRRAVDFSEWDEDDNGTLSRAEFRVWMSDDGALGDFDADQDDEISRDEFSTAIYTRWDDDGSGTISRTEWEENTGSIFPEGRERSAWQDWDADGDSELDLNEVREGLEFDGVYDIADGDNDALFDDEEFADFFFDVYDFDDDDEIDTTEWDDFGTS